VPTDSIRSRYDDAQQILDGLRVLGIGYDNVVQRLEDDGVETFDAAWAHLAEQLTATLHAQPLPRG
jgi:transaldolase